MIPLPLVARGPWAALLFASPAILFTGLFWVKLEDAKVDCGGNEVDAFACADAIIGTAMLAVLSIQTIIYAGMALALPIPKIRSLEDSRYHWLSSEFTHIVYTHPDKRGHQHVLYLNHPTSPSKIRFNIADPGTHFSKLIIRDTKDLSRWPKRQQGANTEAYVDVSRDDEMPPQFNDLKPIDVLDMGSTLSNPILNYLAGNKLNGSCFLLQDASSGGIRSGTVKIMPSASGDNGDFPALECGTDIKAFNTSISLY